MKYGKLMSDHRHVFTLEVTEIYHEMTRETRNGMYTYSECTARKTLLENQVFQWDCAMFGFPVEMNILESDTPNSFDIEVIWRN